MVAIQLDQGREELLDQLARAEGAEPADVARRVLEDYLDFRSLPQDDLADWAEASVRLTPEIMSDESWDGQ
jgi:predicted transcriptional regulator